MADTRKPLPSLRPTIRQAAVAAALEFGVAVELMRSHTKRKQIVEARHVAYWLAYRKTGKTSVVIGRYFHRDHSTVLAAANRIDSRIREDADFAGRIGRLVARLERYEGQRDAAARTEAVELTERALETVRARLLAKIEADPVDALCRFVGALEDF